MAGIAAARRLRASLYPTKTLSPRPTTNTPSPRPRPQDAIAATRIPAQPSKKQLEDAAEAARVAALAAAALERRNAPPVSKLEALALRVEERRSTSERANDAEADARVLLRRQALRRILC